MDQLQIRNALRQITGQLGRERMTVRTFKYREDMHQFLNKNDNTWREIKGFTSGTYASVGGQWVNVKKLDPGLLAHI